MLASWDIFIASITLPILLSACTVGPDYQRPTASVPVEFKELKGWKTAQPQDQQLSSNWWTLFKDPELNRLEAQVNINNQALAQADAQFRQAQSLVQEAKSAYFPTERVPRSPSSKAAYAPAQDAARRAS